jgi:hypothetical protein
MIFAFRGMRRFQVLLALVALLCGVLAAVTLKGFADGRGWGLIIAAVIFGVVFGWAFAGALRAPTSYVAVAEERTRIRFAGMIDTVVANSSIRGVRLVNHPWYAGLGVRRGFDGTIALATTSGTVAEFDLATPVKVWVVPGIWRSRTQRLRVSLLHPEKLAERFPSRESPPAGQARSMRRDSRRRRR